MLQDVRHLRWRVQFIRAVVRTDDGKIFKVKLDQTILRELVKAFATAKALDDL